MAKLNMKKIAASTTLECIVASVVWMITFLFAMEVLTRVTLRGSDQEIAMTMEIASRECCQEFLAGRHEEGAYTRVFDWGTIAVNIMPYNGRVYLVEMRLLPANSARAVTHRYMIDGKVAGSLQER